MIENALAEARPQQMVATDAIDSATATEFELCYRVHTGLPALWSDGLEEAFSLTLRADLNREVAVVLSACQSGRRPRLGWAKPGTTPDKLNAHSELVLQGSQSMAARFLSSYAPDCVMEIRPPKGLTFPRLVHGSYSVVVDSNSTRAASRRSMFDWQIQPRTGATQKRTTSRAEALIGEVSAVRVALTAERVAGLFAQIGSLLADDSDEAAISVSSFRLFLRSLPTLPEAKHPALSISRSGSFIASWRPKKTRKLSLTFGNQNEVIWIATDTTPGEQRGSSGKTDLKGLRAVLKDQGVYEWILPLATK